MPSSRKLSSLSSFCHSPPPPTPSSDHSNGSAGNSVHNKGQSTPQRRLTRQRKLRHLSDQDIIGLHFRETSSLPASPQSLRKSRSPGCSSEHWSSSAVPQPLPLPESPLTRRTESTSANSGHSPLGSPPVEHLGFAFGCSEIIRNTVDREAIPCTKSTSNHRRSSCDNPTNENSKGYLSVNIPTSSFLTNVFSTQVATQKSSAEDHSQSQVPANEDNSSCKDFIGFNRDVLSERIPIWRVHVAKSAPTSAPSSPVTSPRRCSNVDIFDPSAPHDFHGNHVGHFPKVTRAKTGHSPDLSPLRSPGSHSPYPNTRIQEASLHHQLQSRVWPENNHFGAHPLPLPPRTLSPAQSPIQYQLSSTPHSAENPSLMKSKWQKIKLIGRGTFGSVFHAINIDTGASCAMKEVDIIPDDPKSAECVKQLEQEIKILSQLHHPNIVRYYGSEIVGDHLYIYMEYVHPGSINKFVREHCGAMTESVVRSFTRHILFGLAYLHSTKTIHRDIKGANLLVDASGVVKLADFGMAKILTGQSYDLSLKGSPYWMAPEVMKAAIKKDDNPDLALAIDIWSLGCTIIEMLTGRPPWCEFEGPQAMFKVLHKTPPIPETLSPEGKDFLQQCFQRDPAQRPSATRLLEHAFVRNMQCQDVLVVPQLNPRVDPTDFPRSPSPRDTANNERDLVPHSMGSRIFSKIQKLIGGTSQHCNAEESKRATSYHHFPKRAELNVRHSTLKPISSN